MNLANGDILTAALAYTQRGWSVIRIRSGTKKAAGKWRDYQKRRPSQSELESWFGNGSGFGLAVVLGEVSSNLVCRDFDDAAAYGDWASTFADLAKTLPTVVTARGRHVYCRAAVLKSQRLSDGEYRANGTYVLLPPSRHPTGTVYTWLIPPPAGEVPLVDPVESGLLPPAQHASPAPREERAAAPARTGLPTLTQRTQRFLKVSAHEGHRNSELFLAACDMAAKSVGRGQAERVLLDACAKCQPPYPTNEAQPTVASAYSQPRQPARTADDPWDRYEIPRCIFQRNDITAADKLLWGALDWRQRDKAECFPSLSTLAKDAGVNRDTASKGIQRLERAGLLTVRRASRQPNHYTTHLPEIPSGVPKAATGPPPDGNPDSNNHESAGGGLREWFQ